MDPPFFSRKLGVYQNYKNELASSPSRQSHVHTMGDNMAYTSGPLSSFNTKVIIVTACLLLVLIFALLLNIFTRWFLRRLLSTPSLDAQSAHKANSGLKEDCLKSLPTITYMCEKAHLANPNTNVAEEVDASSSQCPICLVDFKDGERIRVLPKCEHGFHVACIDTWLSKHTSCPTCRGDLIDITLQS